MIVSQTLIQIPNHFTSIDEIKSIYLNKTELAYTIKMPSKNDSGRSGSANAEVQADKKPFDNHLNFIYVIQPFTQKFARIKYPFDEDHS